MKLNFSPLAEIDLEDIADYIALDNPRRAATYVAEIQDHCFGLLNAPEGGARRDYIRPGLRMAPYGNYLIFYKLYPSELRIERVLHSARNIQVIFDGDA